MTDPPFHASLDDLLDLFEARLADQRERAVEEHIAECAECTRLARQVYAGEIVVGGWTAGKHGRAQLRAVFARALADTAAQPGTAWSGRLERWHRRWSDAAEAAARVVIEGTAAAGRVLAVGLDALSRPGSDWHFSPEPQAVPVRGATDETTDSAVLTTPVSAGGLRARVAVIGGDEGEIAVRVDDAPPGAPLPIVLLVDSAAAVPAVRVAALERQPDTSYAVARFEDLPPGDYVVALEPMEALEPTEG
ncbi:hypothetical protein L6Q96_10135 [Candidatus Binatia bacterium]|nr:hypothetical protein [Candidatus Binatia bacterium]